MTLGRRREVKSGNRMPVPVKRKQTIMLDRSSHSLIYHTRSR
jgi:hypothetical protein